MCTTHWNPWNIFQCRICFTTTNNVISRLYRCRGADDLQVPTQVRGAAADNTAQVSVHGGQAVSADGGVLHPAAGPDRSSSADTRTAGSSLRLHWPVPHRGGLLARGVASRPTERGCSGWQPTSVVGVESSRQLISVHIDCWIGKLLDWWIVFVQAIRDGACLIQTQR